MKVKTEEKKKTKSGRKKKSLGDLTKRSETQVSKISPSGPRSILAASGTGSALSDHSIKRFTQLGLIIRKRK